MLVYYINSDESLVFQSLGPTWLGSLLSIGFSSLLVLIVANEHVDARYKVFNSELIFIPKGDTFQNEIKDQEMVLEDRPQPTTGAKIKCFCKLFKSICRIDHDGCTHWSWETVFL